MTSEDRVRAALDGYIRSDEPGTTHADAMGLALDAALADLGGLDGLTLLADLTDQSLLIEDRKATLVTTAHYERLRADRDRLREALREIAAGKRTRYDGMGANIERLDRRGMRAFAAAALRESEAGR